MSELSLDMSERRTARPAAAPQGKRSLARPLLLSVAGAALLSGFAVAASSVMAGLVMPIPLKLTFSDGSNEIVRIPAEVWRYDPKAVTWQYVTPKTITGAEVDPLLEIADADRSNNVYRGAIRPAVLEIEDVEDLENRMKDFDVQVKPGSLRTYPAPVAK